MKRLKKLSLGVLFVGLLGFLFFNYIIVYITPFIFAIILAVLIDPVVIFLEEQGQFSRGISVTIILSLLILLIGFFMTISLVRFFIEIERLSANFPDYGTMAERLEWILGQNEKLGVLFEEWEFSDRLKEAAVDNLYQLYEKVHLLIKATFISLLDWIRRVPRLISIFFITLLSTFFISRDKDLLMETLLTPFSSEAREAIKKMQVNIICSTVGFLRAQAILITITTTIAIVGLLIIRSEYVIVIALLCGVLDIIPVIGPGLIFIPWAGYNLIFASLPLGISLLVIYGLISAIRQATEAKIIGQNIGIHPLATLVAIYLGIQFFGLMGFLVGPIILIIIKAIFESGIIYFII